MKSPVVSVGFGVKRKVTVCVHLTFHVERLAWLEHPNPLCATLKVGVRLELDWTWVDLYASLLFVVLRYLPHLRRFISGYRLRRCLLPFWHLELVVTDLWSSWTKGNSFLLLKLDGFVGLVYCKEIVSAATDVKHTGVQLVLVEVSRLDGTFSHQTVDLHFDLLAVSQ